MGQNTWRHVLIVCYCLWNVVYSVYLPGVIPHSYLTNENVSLTVNLVRSSSTLIPYSYYSLPVCRPAQLQQDSRNLGRVITGSAPYNSRYEIHALHRIAPGCRTLCGVGKAAVRTLNNEEIQIFSALVDEGYQVEWIVDNLPVVIESMAQNEEGTKFKIRKPFFPVGRISDSWAFPGTHNTARPMNMLFNHHKLTLHYQKLARGVRITGVFVQPWSIAHSTSFMKSNNPHEFPLTCWEHLHHEPLYLNTSAPSLDVIWTYSVDWKEDPHGTTWGSRWDALFQELDWESHWFGVASSLLILLPLSLVTGAVMVRTCRKAPSMNVEEEIEQSGWKLLHGDVFRAPQYPLMLAVLTGSAAQMVSTLGIVAVFSMMGMLAPPNRGGMLTAIVMLYVLMGSLAGYVSARMYRQFRGGKTLLMMAVSLLLAPGIFLVLYFGVNVVLWFHRSSAGLSAPMVLFAFALWGVHSVLVIMGMLVGLRAGTTKYPTSVNNIPRFIPKQPWYNNRWLVFFSAGILPFSVFWIELYYMLQAIWLSRWISTFSFVFVSLLCLSAATACTTLLAIFLRLRTEDYHWWWRSFVVGCSPAFYVFFYMMYFLRYMTLTASSGVAIYVMYSLIMSSALALFLGGIGLAANMLFVTGIYGNLQGID